MERLFESKVMRRTIDNNRRVSRDVTRMRTQLSKEIQSHKNSFLLFDIHSFTHGSDFHLRSNPDVVLMYIRGFEWLTQKLFYNLDRLGVRVKMIEGSMANDIMVEAMIYGGQATLIEIKQSVHVDSVIFKRIVQAIQATI